MTSTATGRNGKAFTIIELVVVIVIIGILAATALPRFVDLAGDAHSATTRSMSGAFSGGVNLVHAGWIAKGATASVDSVTVEGGGSIGVNDSGWPENNSSKGGDGYVSADECASLWSGLLSSAPSISPSAGAADWQADTSDKLTCRYTYNAAPDRFFEYNASTGALTVTVP